MTGRYSMAELFGNRHVEQLVIPEIQRDYVWGKDQVKCLLDTILNNFKDWNLARGQLSVRLNSPDDIQGRPKSEEEIQSLKDDFASYYAKRFHATNIGFIYAYSDGDLPGEFFLIDGQQRLTTLYLILLAVAACNTDLKERFRARYCLQSPRADENDSPVGTKLDYRLREHTADFLHHFVPYLLENPDSVAAVKQQSWYRHSLGDDITVINLIENFSEIYKMILKGNEPELFEYLEELVDCWYFDTNESAQGEELYIYLNARGESIAENENRKAKLLAGVGAPEQKDKWGKSWEEWQDFFWQRRKYDPANTDDNPNADRGFNSFLDCIENLEKLRTDSQATLLSLESIEKYYASLKWLEDSKDKFKSAYTYAGWIDSWFKKLWSVFNDPKNTDWGAKHGDSNKSTEHNRMILLWGGLLSVICALEKADNKWEDIDSKRVFRTIRIFWLRYNNFNRAVVSLPKDVRKFLLDEPDKSDGTEKDEEAAKWNLLITKPDEERRAFESVIWEIEDHPLNLNGRDLNSMNISHLVDLDASTLTLGQLEMVRDAFFKLFPVDCKPDDCTSKRIAQALLYYGEFWHRIYRPYYDNYDFRDWKRTIRGRGDAEKSSPEKSVFLRFFQDFMQAKVALEEFLQHKIMQEPVNPETETKLINALIWYSEKLKEKFFEKGMYIAINANRGSKIDALFPHLGPIWNTQGDFRGYSGNQELAKLVPSEAH